MPQFFADVTTDGITDEEYIVLRSKQTLQTNPYQCKAWTLTAKTLFPRNFEVQFEAYLIEKNSGNAAESAKCFTTLFRSFASENGLWNEIYALTNALGGENLNSDALFLRKMFPFIPSTTQHDILTLTAERSEDTMEHCRLMLLLFHKFPQTTPQLIVRLVDTLITAEKHGHCPSVVNCYRKTLVCDVLPLLLHTTVELPSKQLYRFLHKSTEFYLACLMSKHSDQNVTEIDGKNDVKWESFFDLLKLFGNKLGWELCSIFIWPWNKDTVWHNISTFSNVRLNTLEPNEGTKQLIYCLTILFAYSLHQYNTSSFPGSENVSCTVLVEAFVTKELDEITVLPPKRPKVDSTDLNAPLLTGGEGTGDVIKHFNFTFKCWNLLHSNETFQKEFVKLKQHVRLDAWLGDFLADVALYRAKYEEFHSNIQNKNGSVRSLVQKLTSNFVAKNYHILGECCIQVVKKLETINTVGNYSQNLTEVGISRHLHYLPVAKVAILQYVVKLLIIMYWQLLPNFTGFDVDRVYGYLLTLCQMNWPTEKRIVLDILSRIRNQRSFTFHIFFKYVVNVEILEEFMHMYGNEQETMKLDLMVTNEIPSQKRISTRGADKEEREDFRQLMKQQVCRQEPLYALVTSFLLQEERFIVFK